MIHFGVPHSQGHSIAAIIRSISGWDILASKAVDLFSLKLMCWTQNLSDFNTGQIVMPRELGQTKLQDCSSCGLFLVCSGQDIPKASQGRKTGEQATGSWVAKTHWRVIAGPCSQVQWKTYYSYTTPTI